MLTGPDIARLGYAVNLGVAAFLGASALVVWTRLRIPGRGPLAVFLGLVSLNYVLEPVSKLLLLAGWSEVAAKNLGILIGAFDPPFLALFALTFAGWRAQRGLVALLFLPSFLHLAYGVVRWASTGESLEIGYVSSPILVGNYIFALLVVAHAHHAARTPRERELRAAMVAILALVVLPRLPLVSMDARLFAGLTQLALHSLLVLDVPLVALVTTFLVGFVATAPAEGRASALRVARQASLLCAIVGAFWLLRLAPGIGTTAFALLYSSRWFVFAGVLGIDAQRQRLLGMPASIARPARAAFLVLLAFLLSVEMTALILGWPGATLVGALLGGAALTTLLLAGGAALVRFRTADEEARLLKRRVYRAHLELSAPAGSLEALRDQLGLSPEDAQEEERLARSSRALPDGALDRPEVGETFARRYLVEGLAGSGSFGLVYAAHDNVTGRKVVLKELRPDWRASVEAARRLQREAELALRVTHPNLVQLIAIERAPHGHVLVFARVEGETLRARLERGRLDRTLVGGLARQIAGGLGALHAHGIIHRDVKPENVVLTPEGDAVLLDLGSSGDVLSLDTLVAGGAHPGTPQYMSPEQRAGAPLTPASDLYALALVLREALGSARSAEWDAFLARALAPEPEARFPDAEAFVAAMPAA